MIEKVEWDSNHFNMKVGRLDVSVQETFCSDVISKEAICEGYSVVYIHSENRLPQLEKNGVFCNEKILYRQPFNGITSKYEWGRVKSIKHKQITKELIQFAYGCGAYSRYNLDSKFSNEQFQTLYDIWLEKSVFTDFSTDILVCYIDNSPAGFVSYKIDKGDCLIQLIYVSPEFRRRGVATSLFNAHLFNHASSIKTLSIVTQGVNKNACALYEKLGYKKIEVSYTYHFWVK